MQSLPHWIFSLPKLALRFIRAMAIPRVGECKTDLPLQELHLPLQMCHGQNLVYGCIWGTWRVNWSSWIDAFGLWLFGLCLPPNVQLSVIGADAEVGQSRMPWEVADGKGESTSIPVTGSRKELKFWEQNWQNPQSSDWAFHKMFLEILHGTPGFWTYCIRLANKWNGFFWLRTLGQCPNPATCPWLLWCVHSALLQLMHPNLLTEHVISVTKTAAAGELILQASTYQWTSRETWKTPEETLKKHI